MKFWKGQQGKRQHHGAARLKHMWVDMAELAEDVKGQDIQLPTWEPKGETHRKSRGSCCLRVAAASWAPARGLVGNTSLVVLIRVGSGEGELHVERHRAKSVTLCLV